MAQTPVQPSGSDLSNVESDVTQTIDLAGTVITLIREPVTLLYNNVTKKNELKRSLGCWQEEALDANGQARIPVLALENFERYLGRTDGAIAAASPGPRTSWKEGMFWARQQTPSLRAALPSAGSASWAYFLFALGIHPGMDVTEWRPRPATDTFITLQNGGVQMEFEGSVLCHIINLFSTTPDLKPFSRSWPEELKNRRLEKHCNFPFGRFAWTTAGVQLHAHFSPGVESALASAKQPFGLNGELMEPGTILASYYTAFYDGGVSDSAYRLATPQQTLPTRIARLIACFKLLMERQLVTTKKKPLLISYDWFEEAARVKRRVLADGGRNHSFFEDILKTASNEPFFRSSEDRKILQEEIRRFFLFDDETFTFLVTGTRETSQEDVSDWVKSWAETTLLGYERQPVGSWKRSLFDTRTDVLEVLKIPTAVMLEPASKIQLIEFTSSCELWNSTVLLGGRS